MKKILLFVLSAALILSLAACGGDTTSDSNVSGSNETNTPNNSGTPGNDADSVQEAEVPNNGEWD